MNTNDQSKFNQALCDHFYAFKSDDINDYDENGILIVERFECPTCGLCWDRKTYSE